MQGVSSRVVRFVIGIAAGAMVVAAGSACRQDSSTASRPANGAGASRPNLLIVVADDLGDWMVGCYGNREFRTPNIDRLATGGVRMGNSYVCTPICSPSRATFLTGLVPQQHGIHDFLTDNPTEAPLRGQLAPPASFQYQQMLSDILARHGYRCGFIGKWHLGYPERPQHGFDEWYSWVKVSQAGYINQVMSDGGRIEATQGYCTELWTQRACQFIRGTRDRPWFLLVSYLNPHAPLVGHPQRYYDLYRDTTFSTFDIQPPASDAAAHGDMLEEPIANLRQLGAAITALDDQLPPLLEALDATGQRERTLVVFLGDNGFIAGQHGLWSKGHATDTIAMLEPVMRVPLIFSWPGHLPAGTVRDEFVSFYDAMPTLLDAMNVPLPSGLHVAGRSYWPLLEGKAETWENCVYGHFLYADMIRDGSYKLVLRHGGAGPNEFYDLATDPDERQNRFDDPSLAVPRDNARAKLEAWLHRFASDRKGG